jgi:protein-S-isoprenylcysteine O-methyltransferase Ste14
MDRKMLLMSILLTITAGGQIFAALFLYNPQASSLVINLGWGVVFLSAIFGWLPIFTLRYRGNIEGRSYVNTTTLVDSGVYGIVRHPQYLAGILLNLGLPMISQHWLVALLGLVSMIIFYLNTFTEEENNLQKFGEAYRRYQTRVPRLNFLLGLYRGIVSGRSDSK